MARSLLDTSALRQAVGPTESGWARGLSQAAKGIASGLEKRFDIKKKEENQFINDLKFDINSVSNDLFKGYAVGQYDKLRKNWVEIFKDQKGWLNPEQKIKLNSDMNSLQSSIEYLNALSEMNDRAMQLQQKDPRIRYKEKQWLAILDLINKEEVDPQKIKEAGSLFMESDADVPGTELVPMDIEDVFINTAPAIKKLLPEEEIGIGVETFKKDGENWEAGYKTIGHGNITDLDNLVYNQMGNKKFNVLKNSDKWALKTLSPEEQKQAILQYGDGIGSLSRYALENKVDSNIKQEFVNPTRKYENINRVPESADSKRPGGKGWTNVKETDIGWEFGTTPVPITKPIEGETYKNASVIGVKKDPSGKYNATIVVPKGKNEAMNAIIKARAEGQEITNEQLAILQQELMDPDKYKTVETPLENIYDELKAGFDKHKLYLQGYQNIKFPEEEKNESDPLDLGI